MGSLKQIAIKIEIISYIDSHDRKCVIKILSEWILV